MFNKNLLNNSLLLLFEDDNEEETDNIDNSTKETEAQDNKKNDNEEETDNDNEQDNKEDNDNENTDIDSKEDNDEEDTDKDNDDNINDTDDIDENNNEQSINNKDTDKKIILYKLFKDLYNQLDLFIDKITDYKEYVSDSDKNKDKNLELINFINDKLFNLKNNLKFFMINKFEHSDYDKCKTLFIYSKSEVNTLLNVFKKIFSNN